MSATADWLVVKIAAPRRSPPPRSGGPGYVVASSFAPACSGRSRPRRAKEPCRAKERRCAKEQICAAKKSRRPEAPKSL